MSIDAIRLQNFMAFKDTNWIELRRINLLLGRNSSGKTVIIRALRLLKQSLLSNGNSSSLEFKTEGGVDLGSFETALHKPINPHEKAEQIIFSFRGWINAQSTGEDIQWSLIKRCLIDVDKRQVVALPFEVNLGYRWEKEASRLVYFQVKLAKSESSREIQVFYFNFDSSISDFNQQNFLFKNKKVFEMIRNICFLPELQITEQADELDIRLQEQAVALSLFWNACRKEIDGFLRDIQYVGPIRPEPERYYAITDEMVRQWYLRGWAFFAEFLKNPLDKDNNDKLRFWLNRMNLGESLVPVPHFFERGDLPKVVELVLYEGSSDNKDSRRNIKDVGYGASQIIPIIVAALTSPDSALVLIEQPELHLHPEAQADIADLLIDSIRNTSRRLLVETHSETLFLRLRVELAKTVGGIAKEFSLNPQSFICHYIERNRQKGFSILETMQFNDRGEYENEPDGFVEFFGQDFKEILDLESARSGG